MGERYNFTDSGWDAEEKLALAQYLLAEMQAFLDGQPEGESLRRGKLLDPHGRDCSYLLGGAEDALIRHRVEDTAETFRQLIADLTEMQVGAANAPLPDEECLS
ncbi:hypothetical protein A2454_06880 [Candidatus Peribacteria bacterium RIFOXYC2_FULL_55_14]|nr:MAG: hypothetical protein UY85_C0023G0008 [Candidatus Peribacteria bacterium GW2011_GWB1_54_5]KKW40156.1 MAG: hypothetical protein UY90_C0087G0003 [Candidatus Peregrinibacteria bacterium GW2011_GWA2_54_9]OGJ72088.1 MAG: hypothetical protein A2198_04430 [Candidatus Peribacteria bacterium RIFOXYA1_FULL_56_14]OGJ74101.1 MAG: hypothetical protein A2217_00450 [Candidatus Peribacteria bacterium RIFOXYA2_FULL_55_28]OGJ75532.1 MAG: hypothetical protein A2384_01410 [Candidatus Peribacteria bacterium 